MQQEAEVVNGIANRSEGAEIISVELGFVLINEGCWCQLKTLGHENCR